MAFVCSIFCRSASGSTARKLTRSAERIDGPPPRSFLASFLELMIPMLSVVIPAFDEEDAIGQTVRTVKETLAASDIAPFEIIVVDDGSADRTREIAAAEGARVVRHLHNLGYGRSLKDGIDAARYDAIAITDADGTYPIKDIPRLFAIYRERLPHGGRKPHR